MCGIAGVLHVDGRRALAAVRAMNDAQAHRGPDAAGIVQIDLGPRSLVLGHRRLAIIDLSAVGDQPMTNPESGDVIVYGGMLYNYRALRDELTALGERFRSSSDTEVVLRALGRWGPACLRRFNGMFALAFFEKGARRLHLARDPLGIKPLYVAVTSEGLVFASEVSALTASGLVESRIDRRALASAFAYGAVVEPLTIIEGVFSLAAGSHLVVDLHAERVSANPLQAERFFAFTQQTRTASVASIGDELGPLLRGAIAAHLQSDAPVGVFLSKGIDSTSIACVASELRNGDVDTFTIAFASDSQMDEGPTAARTARLLGTRHHDITVPDSEVRTLVSDALASMDQPSVDGLNTFILARTVSRLGVKVALSGLGGDELFGGYSTFRQVPSLRRGLSLFSSVGGTALSRAASLFGSRRYFSERQKWIELGTTPASIENVYFRRRRLMSDAQMRALGFQSAVNERAFLPEESDLMRDLPADEWAAVRTLEARFYMRNTLLRDSDMFGLANGVEIRVPLLDRTLVEATLRYSRKPVPLGRSSNKPWLVAAVGARMPRDIAAMAKRGFSLPQDRWMRSWLRSEFESRIEALAGSGLVRRDAPTTMWREFLRTKDATAWSRAWMLGVVGSWLERTSVRSRSVPSAAAYEIGQATGTREIA